MKVAYLHIGPAEHGISRYGRLLAEQAQKYEDLEVFEVFIELGKNRHENRELLIGAAQKLSKADVVHLQFSKYGSQLWGTKWLKFYYLRTFLQYCKSRIIFTLHDVYYLPYSLPRLVEKLKNKIFHQVPKDSIEQVEIEASKEDSETPLSIKNIDRVKKTSLVDKINILRNLKKVNFLVKEIFGPEVFILYGIASRASKIIVCTQEEADRLKQRMIASKVEIVPHFVELRSISITSEEARNELQLQGVKVVTLLGFIYPPKGHQLLVEAMPELPNDITVIFAGGPSSDAYEDFASNLRNLADQKGVGDRLRITGYLSEEIMEMYLSATDLAVCPFSRISASGSLSTWISVACPILASASPQIAEYNRIEPGAINTFSPYSSAALAKAITSLLDAPQRTNSLAIKRLRDKLLIPKIFNQHRVIYHEISK